MAQRLLLSFSYLGTNYKGMQRTLSREFNGPDLETVQGVIEFGLNKVLKTDNTVLSLSSRTDSGVHAIQSAAHFDNEKRHVNPTVLCQGLNDYLDKNQTDIRIKRIVEVPTDFHSRFQASSRSYCYRIAVLRNDGLDRRVNTMRLTPALPIHDLYRCEPILQPSNLSAVFDACKIFLGKWNFKTFSTNSTENEAKMEEKDYNKTILNISFSKCSDNDADNSLYTNTNENIEYYEFHIEGSGFLRRQVRRMVGTLLAVANGIITEEDIKYMLENPKHSNWNNKCLTASSHGLFLKSVNYGHIPIVRF